MSVASPAAGPSTVATGPDRRPWSLWRRQVAAILRLEIRKSFLGKRAFGLYFLALMPVVILGLKAVVPGGVNNAANVGEATMTFAITYQVFLLRLVIFFACIEIFGNLIRREMLDRSLHYYFLAPVRREVLAAAKYLTGLIVSYSLFGVSTLATFALAYCPHSGLDLFFLHGPGFANLAQYLAVTFLACLGYGAVFLTFGFFWKSPAIPAVAVFGWETINFLLPPVLKKISIIYYLQALCPVPIPEGTVAFITKPPSPWIAVPGLFVVTAALLAVSAWKVRRMEISYEED